MQLLEPMCQSFFVSFFHFYGLSIMNNKKLFTTTTTTPTPTTTTTTDVSEHAWFCALYKFSFIHSATTTSTTTVSTTTTTTTTTLSMGSTGGDFGLSGLRFGFGFSGLGFGGGLGVGGLVFGASMNRVHDQGCPSSSCQTSC